MQSTTILMMAFAIQAVRGHMAMTYPPPFRSAANPLANPATIDYSMTSPLKADGSDFPCKGYLTDFTPGSSVATWAAGSSHNFTIAGGASHNGGSCQASLSYDSNTFVVIHSYEGGCPLTPNFNFVVPDDAPAGRAIFSWSWVNFSGNRELYQNCASVTITGGASSKKKRSGILFSSRPTMFVANIGNGCNTIEGTDMKYPNPGPDADVTVNSSKLGGTTGTCAAVHGNGGPGGNSGSIGAPASSSAIIQASSVMANSPPTTLSPLAVPTSIISAAAFSIASAMSGALVLSSAAPSAAPSVIPSGNLKVSLDGQCSGSQTCAGSIYGACCSTWGWCGNTAGHCGTGCQSGFGSCGPSFVGLPPSHVLNSALSAATVVTATASSSLAAVTLTTLTSTTVTMLSSSTLSVPTELPTLSLPSAAASNHGSGFIGVTVPSTFVTSYMKPSSTNDPVAIIPITTSAY